MKDAVATMGTILDGQDVPERDAVHVAVISAIAGNVLGPGDDVYYDKGVVYKRKPNGPLCVGIVDPFLDRRVAKGQKVWLFLYPRTITGLSHVWEHPAFPNATPAGYHEDKTYAPPNAKLVSEQWLKHFAETSDCPGYHALMDRLEKLADDYNVDGWGDDDYMHFSGVDAHGEIPDEVYAHAEIVLGKKIKLRPKYFSCSC